MNPRLLSIVLSLGPVVAGRCEAEELSTVELVRRARPSVVRIEVTGTVVRKREGETIEAKSGATASGFLIDAKGHILTNAHVFEPVAGRWKATPKTEVTLAGLEEISQPAEVVGVDVLADLACNRD